MYFLGGTISMSSGDGAGVRPTLGADDLTHGIGGLPLVAVGDLLGRDPELRAALELEAEVEAAHAEAGEGDEHDDRAHGVPGLRLADEVDRAATRVEVVAEVRHTAHRTAPPSLVTPGRTVLRSSGTSN